MKYLLLIIITGITSQVSFAENQPEIDQFMMDYPHGGNRILVTSSGEASLFYGASPKTKILKSGVFFANDLYVKFKPYLHESLPREKPDAVYGMVKLIHHDGSESNYLIFELNELTESVFAKANDNVVQQRF
jgi:hypothetical protein